MAAACFEVDQQILTRLVTMSFEPRNSPSYPRQGQLLFLSKVLTAINLFLVSLSHYTSVATMCPVMLAIGSLR